MTDRDWWEWHAPYDQPGSELDQRLRAVQQHIRDWLVRTDSAQARVVSACAGQGRDLLEVLAEDGAGRHVTARLIEADPRNAQHARQLCEEASLRSVEVTTGDAGIVASYVGAIPADLVLMCGVFGNISDDDIKRTIHCLPQLCGLAATVIWTPDAAQRTSPSAFASGSPKRGSLSRRSTRRQPSPGPWECTSCQQFPKRLIRIK